MLQLRGNHTANYRCCSKWKEATAAAAKHAQGERGQKDGVSTHLPASKSAPARPPEQEKLGPGWKHVVRGGSVVKAQATKEPTPNPPGAGGQTGRRAAPADGQPKHCPPGAPVVDPQPPQNKHTDSSTPPTTESVTTRGDHRLPRQSSHTCLRNLTRRLLSTSSSLPTGDARPPAVLKTVILFLAQHGGAA
jgi:hypothetical protein